MGSRVLVIDDDESYLASTTKILRRENIEVVTAASPAEAIKIYNYEKMDFDLLLMDFEL